MGVEIWRFGLVVVEVFEACSSLRESFPSDSDGRNGHLMSPKNFRRPCLLYPPLHPIFIDVRLSEYSGVL